MDPSGLFPSLTEIQIVALIVGTLSALTTFTYQHVVKKQSILTSAIMGLLSGLLVAFMILNAPLIVAAVASAATTTSGAIALSALGAIAIPAMLQELWFMAGVLSSERPIEEKFATLAMILNMLLVISAFQRAATTPSPAPPSPGQPTTTLYRAVSHAEATTALESQKLSPTASTYGKHFATTYDDAVAWGNKMYSSPSEFTVIEVDVPSSMLSQFYHWERLDTIGPAFYAEMSQLTETVIRLATPGG